VNVVTKKWVRTFNGKTQEELKEVDVKLSFVQVERPMGSLSSLEE
jgi:hypothetical protein